MLIVSSESALQTIPHVVTTVALTTRERAWATRIPITGPKTGLDRPTWAICEQIRTISTERLGEYVGTADAQTMERIDKVLRYLRDLL